MGMYEEARAAANEALVAHINFVRKLIANRLDISERSIRLLPEEMRRAATMAASSALMTSFRPHLLEIANERPEILDGPVASGETGAVQAIELMLGVIGCRALTAHAPRIAKL